MIFKHLEGPEYNPCAMVLNHAHAQHLNVAAGGDAAAARAVG